MANLNTDTDWSKFDFSDEGIDALEGSGPIGSQTDWNKFDFSDEGISAFESIQQPEPEPGFIDMVKEVGLETAKAAPGVLGTFAAQIALLPGSGLIVAIDLIPTISTDPDDVVTSDFSEFLDPSTGVDPIASRPAFKSGSLSKAEETFKEIMSFPSQFITTEEQAKAIENLGYVAKPIEWSGQAAGLIGRKLNEGLKYLGFADTYIEPLLATYGEFAAVLILPGVIKRLAKTPVKQRGLKVQDLLDEVEANPNMTEAQILRRAGPESKLWEAKRAELRKTEPVRPKPTIKTEAPKGSVPKAEPVKTMPLDRIPDYEFVSKKHKNVYKQIDGVWYDKRGKEITNRFIIAAAEKSKTRFIDVEDVVEPLIKTEKEEVPGVPKEVRKKIEPTVEPTTKPLTLQETKDLGLPPELEGLTPEQVKNFLEERDIFEGLGDPDILPADQPVIQSSFREPDPEVTKKALQTLPDYKHIDTPEALVKRLTVEINAGIDDPTLDTSAARQLISQLAIQLEKWAAAEGQLPGGIFETMSMAELGQAAEVFRQLDGFAKSGEVRKKIEPSENPLLTSSSRSGDIIHLGFDATSKIPTVKELGSIVGKLGSKASITKFKLDLLSGTKGIVKFRLDVTDPKTGVSSTDSALKLYRDMIGKEGPISERSAFERAIPLEDRFRASLKIEPTVDLYSLGGAVAEGVRQLFNKLTFRKIKPQPIPSKPFIKELAREGVRERRSTLDLATYDTNLFINSLERKTSPIQREALTFMLEKTGVPDVPGIFSRPDIKKSLEKDKKYLKPIAAEIKRYLDSSWEDIKKYLPDLTVRQIENYITHLWDIPKHKRAEAAAWFSTHARFLEPRFIDTYKAGIERGYKPKTLDVAEIIKVRDSAINRAIANAQYVKALLDLKADGIHLIQRSTEAPLDYVEVDYPMLTRRIPLPKSKAKQRKEFVKESRVRVHPDLVRPLKVIFEERFDHPVVSAYEAINGVMKKSILSLSLFHHGALGETGLILIGPIGTAKIYFDPVKIYEAMVRGEFEIFNKVDIARDSIVHGTQYGATADYPVANIQRWLNDLARHSEGLPIANRITKFATDFNSTWDKALWNYLHDTLKLYAYEALVAKMDPKLDPFQTTRAKREIAQFVNDTFGGQQWDNLMITPKEVQMMTWSLLSADWTFSTTRQALALTGIGRVHKETAGLRRKLGWKFWGRAGLYFGVGMNALNELFREWDIKENPQYYDDGKEDWDYFDKTMFGNTPGKKTNLFVGRYEDGSERYLKWGKQLWDFFELIINPPKKIGGKISPLPQLLASIFTGHSLSGFKNDDTYKKKGLEKALGIAKTVAKAFIPLSIKKTMQDDVEFKVTDVVMRSTKGMTRYTAIDYFKQAIVDGDERMIEETYRATLRNNLPAFTLFNNALGWIGAEASAKLRETVDDIEDVKAKISVSESSRDKMRLGKMLSKLEREREDIKQGTKLLKGALEKAKLYDMSEKMPSPIFPVSGRLRSPRL